MPWTNVWLGWKAKPMSAKIPTAEDAVVALREFSAAVAFPEVFPIDSNEDYERGADILRQVKQRQTLLKTLKTTLTGPIADLKKGIEALFSPEETRLVNYEASLKRGVNAFLDEQERLRLLEQARLRDEAAAEQAKIEQRAASLESRGKTEQAAALIETIPAVPVVMSGVIAQEGISRRGVWKFEVTDPMALYLSVALLETGAEYIQPNEVAIGQLVRNLKDKTTLPGVRVWEEKSVAVRA